ncbi:hypothetical protein [Frankia sp. R82]|uniref:hypothetical protein n=1 Tax=Frankia sp. R82 TaxID=2950553 RepID=UPI002042E6EB|nr:hypothetical protein [Frankia sp. R82]MCM3884653.1 hypothetical protein [Frankia sp. R82]
MVNILLGRVSGEVIRRQGLMSAASLPGTGAAADPMLARARYAGAAGQWSTGARTRVLGLPVSPMVPAQSATAQLAAMRSATAQPCAGAAFGTRSSKASPLAAVALLTVPGPAARRAADQLSTNRHLLSGFVLDPLPE